MTAYAIDTLEAMRELEQAGFEPSQAEAVTKLIAHQGEGLATKADITGIRQEMTALRHEIAGLRWTFGILFGFMLALNLTMFGFLFAVWRDVASLAAG